MENKYYNDAIIGNNKIVASFTKNGELQRLYYPEVDGRQFVDYYKTGITVNESELIYLHDDINNTYSQHYIENTNIVVTNIKNSYFNLDINQTDFAIIDKNIIAEKYIIKNNNQSDLNFKFIVNSKILSNELERYGSKIFDNGVIQYNHNFSFVIFSAKELNGHKLNDVQRTINTGIITDKDYIGMSNEIAISYDLGQIKSGEEKEFSICIYVCETEKNIDENIVKTNIDFELERSKKYWEKYINEHSKLNQYFINKIENSDEKNRKYYKKILEIYNRTILLFSLLTNKETGGIVATLEPDENRTKCGCYAYCWPRDSVFLTKAFDLLNMYDETEKFYNIFCEKTQNDNGMWEQRFYADGTLAPCWGYQIDETASVVYGIYDHYLNSNNIEFLNKNLHMCEKAIGFLFEYVENLLGIDETDLVKKSFKEKNKKYFEIEKHVSYDLWEMNEGVHLYSLSSIISSFESMINIYKILDKNQNLARLKIEKHGKIISKLENYIKLLKNYINDNLVDKNSMILKRNLKDNNMDISVIGSVYPFDVFSPNDKIIENTIDKINMTLRTYSGGYLRFENDNYMGGNNPWIITTLWMALYYIKINDFESAKQCFDFVVDTCLKHCFLAEQVNNEDKDFKWIVGLGWSHAMYIIVLNELVKNGII